MPRSLSTVLVLLLAASVASAQEPASPSQPPAPATAPDAPPAPPEPTPPPAPPAPAIPQAFNEGYLTYDPVQAQAYRGKQRTPIAREDFYMALGRPDLIEKCQAASSRRVLLYTSAIVVGLAGAVGAGVSWGTLPDLNSGFCVAHVENYNSDACAGRYKAQQAMGAAFLVGGLGVGGLLATFGYWSSPDVIGSDEAAALISKHNAALLQRSRASGPSSFLQQLRVTPYATLDGGGVITTLRF
jgi:hypothetical protein